MQPMRTRLVASAIAPSSVQPSSTSTHGVAHDRREVVEVPEVVEVALVGDLPDRAELRDVGVLLRELEADANGFHAASLAPARRAG